MAAGEYRLISVSAIAPIVAPTHCSRDGDEGRDAALAGFLETWACVAVRACHCVRHTWHDRRLCFADP